MADFFIENARAPQTNEVDATRVRLWLDQVGKYEERTLTNEQTEAVIRALNSRALVRHRFATLNPKP